jgi:NADH:ubiquinone oxidoreductase subunit H
MRGPASGRLAFRKVEVERVKVMKPYPAEYSGSRFALEYIGRIISARGYMQRRYGCQDYKK